MNKHLYRASLLAGFLSFGAIAVSAQTSLRATVPFSFQLPHAQMPPGDYTVQQLSPGSPMIVFRNWRANKGAMVMTSGLIGDSRNESPRLVFRCAGNQCALSEVWGALPEGGVRLPPPRVSPRDKEQLSVVYMERKPADKK
jgi:hypothetical protein